MIFVAIQFMEQREKSWRSQFMMRQHQFIHKKQAEQEQKDLFPFTLALSVLGLAHLRLTSQTRCSQYHP
jgi:hypothetical protein